MPVPAYRRVNSAEDAVAAATAFGFAAIGKTAYGFGGQAVARLADVAAVREWWARVRGPALVQRFVTGRYATTEMLYARGRLLAYVTSLRTDYWPTPLSASTTREIIDLPEMRPIVERLGAHTGFDGLCSIDFILDDDGDPQLSELNARPTPGYEVRADVMALFAEAARDRLAGVEREPASVTRSSGPMHQPSSAPPKSVRTSLDSEARFPLNDVGLPGKVKNRKKRPVCSAYEVALGPVVS